MKIGLIGGTPAGLLSRAGPEAAVSTFRGPGSAASRGTPYGLIICREAYFGPLSHWW